MLFYNDGENVEFCERNYATINLGLFWSLYFQNVSFILLWNVFTPRSRWKWKYFSSRKCNKSSQWVLLSIINYIKIQEIATFIFARYSKFNKIVHQVEIRLFESRYKGEAIFKSIANPITRKIFPYALSRRKVSSFCHLEIKRLHDFLLQNYLNYWWKFT